MSPHSSSMLQVSLEVLAHVTSQALASEQPVPIGLDTEWRPDTFGPAQPSVGPTPTALLQIAFVQATFLLDLQQLSSSQLDTALLALFATEHVIKVGYGWATDLSRLHSTFPTAECFMRMSPVVDFRFVTKAGEHSGLNGLVERVLHAPLDKSQQASDWSQRPLTPEQVLYAAADASCLLELWETLPSNTYGCAPRSMEIHDNELVQVPIQQSAQQKAADVGAELERLCVPHEMIVAEAVAPDSTIAEGNTILFIVDGVPVVVLVQKGARVALPHLAAAFGVRKKRVRLAHADECVTYTGYSPGHIPPVAHTVLLEVCVDASLQDPQGDFTARRVRFSGGVSDTAVPMHVVVSLTDLALSLKAIPLRDKGMAAAGTAHGGLDTARACSANHQIVLSRVLQLSGSEHTGRPLLLLDHMLARPAKWLRNLGIDTEYQSERDYESLIQRASAQCRVIVTADRNLVKCSTMRDVAWLWICEGKKCKEQVAYIVNQFQIVNDPALYKTRCDACNGHPLHPVPKQQVLGRVPASVEGAYNEFSECPDCGKVYWPTGWDGERCWADRNNGTGPIAMMARMGHDMPDLGKLVGMNTRKGPPPAGGGGRWGNPTISEGGEIEGHD